MILSRDDIERRAKEVPRGYMGGMFPDNSCRVDIDAMARRLGLRVCRTRLSDDGSLLGVTTYVDAEVELKRYCSCETLYVPKNTVLLDESLYGSDAVPGRLRYTMAHECAHHILWRDEPDERKRSMRTHSMRTSVYRGRRGNSEDIQTERQADALAAALLMPPEFVWRLTERFARGRRFVSYDGKLNRADRLALTHISGTLGVSRTALIIRLRQLGYLKDMPRSEYHDPTEVWCDG